MTVFKLDSLTTNKKLELYSDPLAKSTLESTENWQHQARIKISVLALLLVFTSYAWADGGNGGDSIHTKDRGGQGGTASSANGENGHDGSGGGGGGVSLITGEGGTGGDGGHYSGTPGGSGGTGGIPAKKSPVGEVNTVNISGGSGGDGGDGQGAPSSGGGGGGGGGVGWLLLGTQLFENTAEIIGGHGGQGGKDGGGGAAGGGGGGQGGGGVFVVNGGAFNTTSTSRIAGGRGGDGGPGDAALSHPGVGGDGGSGVVLSSGSVTNAGGGDIIGGIGGAGGAGAHVDGARGGTGGAGISGSNFTVRNEGQITGGQGGVSGNSRDGDKGDTGAGGAGIIGINLKIINGGHIAGGMSGDGAIQADAITFTDGTNNLELHHGYHFTGNVDANAGEFDTLALGGSIDSTFSVDQINDTMQYRGFEAFEKTGTSTWTLTGATTAQTPWTISDGVLSVSSDASLGHQDGKLTFDGGILQVTGIHFNATERDIVWGDYGGGFDIVHQDNNFQLDQNIAGAGDLVKYGAGTLRLTGDNSGFAGTTTIAAGTLQVGDADGHGSLGGSLNVLAQATLGGSGIVGSGTGSLVTLAPGSTLAPGNSIGALTVDGDLVVESGSRFEVEVNPSGSDSDHVRVTGNATLNGGTVVHIGTAGDYGLRSAYTILSAGGTLSGVFADVSSDFAFLTPGLLYDYGVGTVALELSRNDRNFAAAARTRNQHATATSIESMGLAAGHAVYDAIVQLPDDSALIRSSFDALSGEIHASIRSALIEDSHFIRNAAMDRIRAAFAAPGASGTLVAAHGSGLIPMQVLANHHGPVVWSHAFGSWGSTSHDGNAARLTRDTGGMLIGADRFVGNWRVGLLAGYSYSDFRARDRASSGKSDNYHLGVYGGTQWHALGLRTGLAYTWHDIDARRSVAIPSLQGAPRSSYRAGTFQAFGELGYGIGLGAGTRLEPYASLAHVRLHTDGYDESGGAMALSGRSDNADVTFTTLGLRAEHRLDAGAAKATLRGALGWRHAFGDTTPRARHGFSAGTAFTVAGAPIAKNSAVLEAGVDVDLGTGATFGLSYAGQLAGSARDHGVRANLAIRF